MEITPITTTKNALFLTEGDTNTVKHSVENTIESKNNFH